MTLELEDIELGKLNKSLESLIKWERENTSSSGLYSVDLFCELLAVSYLGGRSQKLDVIKSLVKTSLPYLLAKGWLIGRDVSIIENKKGDVVGVYFDVK